MVNAVELSVAFLPAVARRRCGLALSLTLCPGSFYRRDFFRKYGNTSSYARSVTKASNFARGVTSREEHNPREHAATKSWGRTGKRD